MNSQLYLYEINRYLAEFSAQIKLENPSGHFDINKHAERFLIPLLNEVFQKEFERLEIKQVNYPAIDLRSKDNQVAIQVTSETGFEKVRDTLSRFIATRQYEKSRLIHLVLDEDYKTQKTNNEITAFIDEELAKLSLSEKPSIDFSSASIWNLGILQKEIENRCSVDQLKKIRNFLFSEYGRVTELPSFKDVLIPYQIAYESQIKPTSSNLPFQFNNPFFGREENIKALREFISSDKDFAISVVADGGYGKTRLCVEFFKSVIDSLGDMEAVVLNDIAFQGRIPLSEIQSGKKIVILVDDAHRKTDILEGLFLAAQLFKNIKLILTIRKPLYGDTIKALPSHARNIPSTALIRLSYDDTLALIKSQMPGLNEAYTRRVAEESKGVPMVILGLCQVIRQGKYSTEISEEENFIRFVQEIKDQVIEDISTKYYIDKKEINKTIQLIALFGPVKNTEEEIKALAEINSMSYEDCSIILSYLEEHELIQRKATISILPDPYSDIIVIDMGPRIKFILQANGVGRFTDRIIRNITSVEHSNRLKLDVNSIVNEFVASIANNKLLTYEEVNTFNNNLETLKHFASKKPLAVVNALLLILKMTDALPEFWKPEPFGRFRETGEHLDTLISIVAINSHGETELNNVIELIRQYVERRQDFTLLTKSFRYREFDFRGYGYEPKTQCERQQFLARKLQELLKGAALNDFEAQFIITGVNTLLRVDFRMEESFDRHKSTFHFGTAQVLNIDVIKAIRDSVINAIIELFKKTRGTASGDNSFDIILRQLHFIAVPLNRPVYILNQSSQVDLVSKFLMDLVPSDASISEKSKLDRQLKLYSRREVKPEYKNLLEQLSKAANSTTINREKIELLLRAEYFHKKNHFDDEIKKIISEYPNWQSFYEDTVKIRKDLHDKEAHELTRLLEHIIINHPLQCKELYDYVRKTHPEFITDFCILLRANYKDKDYFYSRLDDIWAIGTIDAKQSVIYMLTFGRNRDKTQYEKRDLKYVETVLADGNQYALRRLSVTLPDFIDIEPDQTLKLCGEFIDVNENKENTNLMISSLVERKDYTKSFKGSLKQLLFDKTISLDVGSHYMGEILNFLEDNFGFDTMFSYLTKKLEYLENEVGLYSIDFDGVHPNPALSQDQKEDNLLKVIEWFVSVDNPSKYIHSKVLEIFVPQAGLSKSLRRKLEDFANKNSTDINYLIKVSKALDVFDDKDSEVIDLLISFANRSTKLDGYSKETLEYIFGSEFIYNGGAKSKSGPGPFPKDVERKEQLIELLKRNDLEKEVREILDVALKIVQQAIDHETKSEANEW